MRYQVLKNGVPIAMCFSLEEVYEYYDKYGADEIREIEDDNDE